MRPEILSLELNAPLVPITIAMFFTLDEPLCLFKAESNQLRVFDPNHKDSSDPFEDINSKSALPFATKGACESPITMFSGIVMSSSSIDLDLFFLLQLL